jgi:hypothetical protein
MSHTFTNLDYLRAHQYLYYCVCTPVLTDYEYDMFGRDTGEDYKGGSDNPAHYSSVQVDLARKIVGRDVPVLPRLKQD